MQKFVFPLQRLLTLKKQLEGQAENRLRATGQQVAKAMARLARLQQQLADVASGTDTAVKPASTTPDLSSSDDALFEALAHNSFADRIEAATLIAQTELAEAKQAHDAEREKYTRVRMEAEALETLYSESWDAHERQKMQAMQKTLDGTLMHQWSRGIQHTTEERKSRGYRDA